MRLLVGLGASVYRTFHVFRVSAEMSSAVPANGEKRAVAEPEDAAAKRPRVDGDGGVEVTEPAPAKTSVEPTPTKTAVEVPPAERWKLKKVLLLVSYSGKGYLGMQR